ncbi:MAG TPA: 3-methyl-2-oxobutanoate hydroxymethyltransferase [Polyangiaceae bacterium]|jgi:3-methyl-2-oxobutanoate hydroxymethyltransferase|nr:3-methyl-2-oxobutanoate hydroxymethyltransferase [Polyangiaceae bacterium]
MNDAKITVPALLARKQGGPKIAMLTAYDATMARLLDEGGADVLLVGDSLGMVVQGLPNTLPVTLEEICYHGRAVARATHRAHVVGDMPFMSYQSSVERALESAGQMLKTGGFEAVKLEGGVRFAEHIRAIVSVGIPVLGHVGLLPQSVHAMGGFRVQGKADADAERVLADARAVADAGAYAVVLEGIPSELGQRITESISIPTIGIGAGPACDGQVLVCYDFLGMYPSLKPKFVKHFAELGAQIVAATQSYVKEVREGSFPDAAHGFASAPKKQPAVETGGKAVLGLPPKGYGPASEDS